MALLRRSLNAWCKSFFSVFFKNKEKALSWFALTAFAGIGLFGYTLQAVDWFHATPGDLIDGRFNSVILEHFFNWARLGLNGQWTDIWSPTFFYPYQNVLGFSDNHFGTALSYALLRSLGFSREISFGGWYVFGVFLNFVCSYFVFRRLQFGSFSSSAAAFVYAFALPVIAQDGHSQFSYRFAVPLAFLAFWQLVNNRNLPSLAWLAFWVSFQFFCSIYLGIFLTAFLMACSISVFLLPNKKTGATLLDSWRKQSTAGKLFYLSVLIVSSLATIALGIEYHVISQQYGFASDAHEMSQMIPRLESYFIADRSPLSAFIGKMFADNLAASPYRSEHQLFFGIGVLIFFVIGTWFCWTSAFAKKHLLNPSVISVGRVAFLALVIIFFGTLTYGIGSAWMQLMMVPGLKFIRAVTRIVLIMTFPVSIMVAVACEKLYDSIQPKNHHKKLALVIGAAILLSSETVFFQSSRTPNEAWAQRLQKLESDLPNPLPANSVLFVVKDESKPGYELPEVDAMVLAQDRGIPTINGYSGKFPPGNEHNPIERCIPAIERLEAYAKFSEIPAEVTKNLIMNKIIQIPNISCGIVK